MLTYFIFNNTVTACCSLYDVCHWDFFPHRNVFTVAVTASAERKKKRWRTQQYTKQYTYSANVKLHWMLRVAYSFPVCLFYNAFGGQWLHGANGILQKSDGCVWFFLNFWHIYSFVLTVSLQVCYKRVNLPLTAFQPAIVLIAGMHPYAGKL